ncbi:olfactory receptor 11H1-like [Lycaon pictus]|nr:olfactory receptor 11H1 isoform X1 [Canis lupus familiaris]XP_038413523.1 olfactory receptor 11H1 isoform X1 [Canis lupus familiaris]XP_038543183.1 olfactory receptor 11H1 isoform X1 [Canis lupus familiaris]|eukprot:XP_022283407.1 olfactory receptor 11H1 [Canis lupus familiaris]
MPCSLSSLLSEKGAHLKLVLITVCLLPLQMTDPVNVSEPYSSFASVREFILLGFSCEWKIQILLFSLFTTTYTLTVTGNGAIVCAIWCEGRLHSPMYMFLGNFSFLEIWYVSSTVPNMLANFLSEKKTISFTGCFVQFYFFFSLGTSECLLLAIMAFDRYLAICRPLHYPNIMTRYLSTKLVIICWVCGFLLFLIPIAFISQMPFCGPNIIDHVVCDPGPLFALACASAPTIQQLCYSLSSLVIFGNFLFILGSYTLVLLAVLHMPSTLGRHKAFSTCGSHLAVVSLFYGSLMIMYVSPGLGHSAGIQKVATLFYAMVTPLFNPLIYSLRNKEIKAALRKVLGRCYMTQDVLCDCSRSV